MTDLAGEWEVIQASALEISDTIFVCGSCLEHSTLYERDEYELGKELVGGSDRNLVSNI